MSNAINANQGNANNAAALPDVLAKLGAGRANGDAAAQGGFARWMEQHSAKTMPSAQADAPGQAVRQTAGAAASAANRPVAQSVAQNAAQAAAKLAASRPQAAPKPAAAPQSDAAAAQRSADARAQRNKAESASSKPASSGTAHATQTDDAASTDEVNASEDKTQSDDETRFTTAMGDGTAMVRELTPPPTVQQSNPADMMAWLVSLTQQEGAQGQGGEAGATMLEGAEGEAGRDLKVGRDSDKPGRGLGRGHGLALGAEQGVAWGLREGGKGGTPASALQVDALLGKASHTPAEGDRLSAVMAGEGARVASFGQALADASQSVRHESATIPVPLDAPDFTQKLADQVSLWVGQTRDDGTMTAELHLNPAEMGPINVKISLDGTSAQVDFAAAAQETRQAIEASLSQLSNALNDVGLSLTGGGVSSQTAQQQGFDQQFGTAQQGGRTEGRGEGRGIDGGNEAEGLGMRQVSAPRTGRLGGLDLYA